MHWNLGFYEGYVKYPCSFRHIEILMSKTLAYSLTSFPRSHVGTRYADLKSGDKFAQRLASEHGSG